MLIGINGGYFPAICRVCFKNYVLISSSFSVLAVVFLDPFLSKSNSIAIIKGDNTKARHGTFHCNKLDKFSLVFSLL